MTSRLEMVVEEPTRVEHPIQMVPLLMREENKESDDYDPKVVSLGPYHHGKEKLMFVEKFKPKALEIFIRNSSIGYGDLFVEVVKNIGYARSCYLQESTIIYNDENFARMMIHDACVILNNIGPSEREESVKRAETIQHLGTPVYTNIRRDMYLLENQVPFLILQILVRLRYGIDGHTFIRNMETISFKMFFHVEEAKATSKLGKEPLHLLEILRSVIVTGHDQETTTPPERCCDINNLVSCLENCRSGLSEDDGRNPSRRGRYVFRSVMDLKSKGIHFRASGIKSLKGVRFNPTELFQSAVLKLPLLYVSMYTRVFFLNMIAYEFSPYVCSNDKSVTAYVSFMKLLVVSKKDVKELREQKIIINGLGSDKEVVHVYKALNTYGAEDKSYFWNVKRDIEEHYNSKAKTWMADLKTTYFNNPWSIIALAGTLLLLCFDIIQTYYAIPSNGDGKTTTSKGGS